MSMQLTGKLILYIRHPEPKGDEGIIELPEVNQENIMVGDTIWVEKVVPSSEPLPQFLKRHPKVVAHFPLLQQEKKEDIELPKKFNPIDIGMDIGDIAEIKNKLNELIVFTQKLAERLKCPLKKR